MSISKIVLSRGSRLSGKPLGVTSMRSLVGVLIVSTLCGCSPGTPEHVYLRTSSVVVTVEVRAESRVKVGEWLRLHASRATTGEWEKVRFDQVPKDSPWIGYIPPEYEGEVAANLRWFAEPMDGVEFDALAPRPVLPIERAVKFAKPGSYRLWATSHAPLDAASNSLHVEVTE